MVLPQVANRDVLVSLTRKHNQNIGVNGPEILLSQQIQCLALAQTLTPALTVSPSPSLVADIQQLILG